MTTMAMAVTTTPFRGFLCNHSQQLPPKPSFSSHPFPLLHLHQPKSFQLSPKFPPTPITPCSATRSSLNSSKRNSQLVVDDDEDTTERKKLVQAVLWVMEGVYIVWLFLLPYAPGDPVWAISSDTIKSLVGLSLNFFFILPIANSGSFKSTVGPVLISSILYISDRVAGIHAMEAPVLHPMSEGLFNFVVGWTFMFAPLLYTDFKNNRYKGSLDVLWGLQMFLTNTFLIPYMAIRLNNVDESTSPKKPSQLGTVMIKGAPVVGLIGGVVCAISLLWSLYGRLDGDFGNVTDRWNFLLEYLGSERLAYAFIWDIVLYTIFQPWLIGENLANIVENKVELVKYIRYIPVVGLLAYLLCLKREVLEQLE